MMKTMTEKYAVKKTDPAVVRLYSTGMVFVYDFEGHRMTELQGLIRDVADRILERSVYATVFERCAWDVGCLQTLARQDFANLAKMSK